MDWTITIIASLIVCAMIGATIAAPKEAGSSGFWCGLFLGPIGVLVATTLDNRPQCGDCMSRVDRAAKKCPHCGATFTGRAIQKED